MVSSSRQSLEDDLSLAQEEADRSLLGMESARRRVGTQLATMTSAPAASTSPLVDRSTALQRDVDAATRSWVAASSHDLYHDADRSLAESASSLRDSASLMGRLQQSWEALETEMAAAFEQLQAQLTETRSRTRSSIAEAREALRSAEGDGMDVSGATSLLDSAESLASSSSPADLMEAGRLAAQALSSAQSLRSLREDTTRRLASTRTRVDALNTKAENLHSTLTVLRREHPQAAWQDVEITEQQAMSLMADLGPRLESVATSLASGRMEAAAADLETFRSDLKAVEEKVAAPSNRLQLLKETARSKDDLLDRARRRVRDAQLFCVNMGTPSREARELDMLSAQLDAVQEAANGRYPDFRRFVADLESVQARASTVVDRLRSSAVHR